MTDTEEMKAFEACWMRSTGLKDASCAGASRLGWQAALDWLKTQQVSEEEVVALIGAPHGQAYQEAVRAIIRHLYQHYLITKLYNTQPETLQKDLAQ